MDYSIKKLSHGLYEFGGVKFPSATRVLGYFKSPKLVDRLLTKSKEEVRETDKQALKVGSLIHAFAETGKIESEDPEIISCLKAYDRWQREVLFDIAGQEVRVVSTKFGYAGTLDFLGTPHAGIGLEVGDFKTAYKIGDSYWLQLAAYANAWEEMTDQKVKNLRVVRFDKGLHDYEEEIRPYEKERYLPAFIGLLKAYQYYEGEPDGITRL